MENGPFTATRDRFTTTRPDPPASEPEKVQTGGLTAACHSWKRRCRASRRWSSRPRSSRAPRTSCGAGSFRNRLVAGAQSVFGVESPVLLEVGAKPRLPKSKRRRKLEEKIADVKE